MTAGHRSAISGRSSRYRESVGHALVRGQDVEDRLGVEAQEVREHPGHGRADDVHEDEHRHEQARLVLHHAEVVFIARGARRAAPAAFSARAASRKARKRDSNTRPAEGLGTGPERGGIKTQAPAASQRRRGAPPRVASRKTTPVSPSITDSAPPPSAKTTTGPPAGHGLDGGDAEVLDAGHDHRAASAVEVAQRGVVHAPQERRPPAGASARRRALFRPRAHDLAAARPRAAIRVEHELDALVGHEGGDHEVVVAGRVRAPGVKKSVSTGGGITVDGAAVVAADAAGHVGAVGGEVVDARRRWPRPRRAGASAARAISGRAGGADAAARRSSRRSGPTRSASACGSSRRARAPERPLHALGHAVRARDHEVVAADVDGRGGGGEQRQVRAVVPLHPGQALDEGGADVARLQLRVERARARAAGCGWARRGTAGPGRGGPSPRRASRSASRGRGRPSARFARPRPTAGTVTPSTFM